MKKTIIAAMMVMIMLVSVNLFSETVNASEIDPQSGRANGEIDEGFFDYSESNNIIQSKFRDSVRTASKTNRRKGIDVSKWQGDVDWNLVKKAGIEFAFIRVGYRSGDTGALGEDSKWVQNIEGALNAGIKVGVYFFSQAIDEQEAIEEAKFLLDRVYKYKIELPLVIDFEYMSGNTGRLYDAHLSKDKATSIINSFCKEVSDYGYTGMVYANKSMLTNGLNANDISAKYRIWLANYQSPQMTDFGEPVTSYSGKYDFFQFSSKGKVDGISGEVDLDYWYDDGTISGKDYTAVFDADYYAKHNLDVVAVYGSDPGELLKHFIENGMKEGRRGNENFDVTSYYLEYADLRRSFGNDLEKYYLHYMQTGKSEGRNGSGCTSLQNATTIYKGIDYSSVYSYEDYVSLYTDINGAYKNDENGALAHFVECGMKEGRQGKDSFNVKSYILQYADLRRAFGNDLKSYYLHFMNTGNDEGRQGTGCASMRSVATTYKGKDYSSVYNYEYYVSNNQDIKQLYGYDDLKVLQHFVECGMNEGRQGTAEFDVNSYRLQYPDLRAAYKNNLIEYYLHFLDCGKDEGRIGTGCTTLLGAVTKYNGVDYEAVYSYDYYLANNADVRKAYAGDDIAVLQHFVSCGMKEGRHASDEFNVYLYKERYYDLRQAFAEDLEAYFEHYLSIGKLEGRTGR